MYIQGSNKYYTMLHNRMSVNYNDCGLMTFVLNLSRLWFGICGCETVRCAISRPSWSMWSTPE